MKTSKFNSIKLISPIVCAWLIILVSSSLAQASIISHDATQELYWFDQNNYQIVQNNFEHWQPRGKLTSQSINIMDVEYHSNPLSDSLLEYKILGNFIGEGMGIKDIFDFKESSENIHYPQFRSSDYFSKTFVDNSSSFIKEWRCITYPAYSDDTTAVPEPNTLLLYSLAIIFLLLRHYKQNSAHII